MTNPTTTTIKNLVGQMWNAAEGTTTTIASACITLAQSEVRNASGTTSGNAQDIAITHLACAHLADHAMVGLGPETVANNNYAVFRDRRVDDANDALRTIGNTLDGVRIRFTQVNQ